MHPADPDGCLGPETDWKCDFYRRAANVIMLVHVNLDMDKAFSVTPIVFF